MGKRTMNGQRIILALILAMTAVTGCLRDPQAQVAFDASTDASKDDERPADAASRPDALVPGEGLIFPPTDRALQVQSGWSGDLNHDGIEDLLLVSSGSLEEANGVYVLYGKSDARFETYQHFLPTGTQVPMGVLATDLDGTGALDILIYSVEFGAAGRDSNESYWTPYLAEGSEYRASNANHLSEGMSHIWHAPAYSTETFEVFTAKLAVSGRLSLVTVHTGGVSHLLLPSVWSAEGFANANAEFLKLGDMSGGMARQDSSDPTLDNVVIWTNQEAASYWLRDAGASVSRLDMSDRGHRLSSVHALPSGDFMVGVHETDISAVPLDDDADTGSARYGTMNYLPGLLPPVDLLLFDPAAPGGLEPALVLLAPMCPGEEGACLFTLTRLEVTWLPDGRGSLDTPDPVLTWPVQANSAAMFRGDFNGDDESEIVILSAGGVVQCVKLVAQEFIGCP